MNPYLPLPDPDRLRSTPPRFSWIDHRLLRDGHLAACASTEALALYLLLVAAADARGVSYYSDQKMCELLVMSAASLAKARRRLLDTGLIAWRRPYYQVLSLDPEDIRRARLRQPSSRQGRSCQSVSIQEALQQIAGSLSKDHDSEPKP
jgi:hypothetical protein